MLEPDHREDPSLPWLHHIPSGDQFKAKLLDRGDSKWIGKPHPHAISHPQHQLFGRFFIPLFLIDGCIWSLTTINDQKHQIVVGWGKGEIPEELVEIPPLEVVQVTPEAFSSWSSFILFLFFLIGFHFFLCLLYKLDHSKFMALLTRKLGRRPYSYPF